ncbi:zinc finger protein 99 [Anastrepha obliqua]|uniref:zinc finger protein 99 n=1 Tax=Anastrepha obliqua TaxID=95512 RepID=UPI002409E87E|nr:zinc finger protein 99 [Anastrepha obliqua]
MDASNWDAKIFCRACAKELNLLKNDETVHWVYIFDSLDFVQKLSACISIEVSATDKYSKYLCICCCQKVNDFFQFREMCKQSIRRFEELQQVQNTWDFEDEIPIPVSDEQTSEILKVDETNCLEDDHGKFERQTKIVKLEQRKVKKYTKEIKEKSRTFILKDADCESETSDQLEQKMDTQKAQFSDEDALDFDVAMISNNASLNEDNTATQTNVVTKCKYEMKTNTNATPSTLSKIAAETKKCTIYRCVICPARFIAEHRLIAHKREHEGLIPYPCPREGCSKSFNHWNSLSRHLSQHDGRSFQYECDQDGCGKVYKYKPTLVMHKRKCHKLGPELKSHICEICGKVFKSTAILNDHRYTHKDKSERPHACNQPNCVRRFSNKEKLKVHLMRHAGIKNYVCPHCGLRKTTMNELKVHINYHTLERTWPCRFCTQVCNSSGNLRTHVRTVHERAKDYACRHCDRTFAKPDTRKYHEMTHTGEKPNECPDCGKRFIQPAALRTHRKIHQRQHGRIETANKSNLLTSNMT